MWIVNWCKWLLILLFPAGQSRLCWPEWDGSWRISLDNSPCREKTGGQERSDHVDGALTLKFSPSSLRRSVVARPAQQTRQASVPGPRQCRKDDAATHAEERPRCDPAADAASECVTTPPPGLPWADHFRENRVGKGELTTVWL